MNNQPAIEITWWIIYKSDMSTGTITVATPH
jgi:hypothetical protein